MASINNMLISATLALIAKKKLDAINSKKKIKRISKQPVCTSSAFLCTSSTEAFFATAFKDLKADLQLFAEGTRMSLRNFQILLALIKNKLQQCSASRILAYGGARDLYATQFKIPRSMICRVFNETCEVLWTALSGIYMAKPDTEEWLATAEQYEQKCQLPNCLGAIACKHFAFKCPATAFNAKNNVTLIAACNTKYCFRMIDLIECKEKEGFDIIEESFLNKSLKEGALSIPAAKPLANTKTPFPYYFVGGSEFPLLVNVMRPYADELFDEEEIFNKKLSNARLTAENAFGVLVTRWRILVKNLRGLPKTVYRVIKACIILHNFLMLQNCTTYCAENYIDHMQNGTFVPGLWRKELDSSIDNLYDDSSTDYASDEALSLRETLKNLLAESEI